MEGIRTALLKKARTYGDDRMVVAYRAEPTETDSTATAPDNNNDLEWDRRPGVSLSDPENHFPQEEPDGPGFFSEVLGGIAAWIGETVGWVKEPEEEEEEKDGG